ncbi:MAG: hypothetical protein QHJ73_07715, partial [Armatimonadota bacterium]|nr:hypothetical protein [Armatimonadota bacterium]
APAVTHARRGTPMPDAVRWTLVGAPSLFLVNWVAVLLATAALTWRRREGGWPPWSALTRLAAGIARNRRTRARTLWLAAQLLVLDFIAPFVLLLARP